MRNFRYKIKNNKFYIELVSPRAEIDYRNANEFAEVIKEGIEKNFDKVYIDFKNLEFIDSAGIGKLVTFSKRAKIILLNVNEKIKKVFEITRLCGLFDFK